jgi:LCP family protein required for cell wall assembly
MPEGVVNIMVLGSDYRESSGYRTDVMMLVSVNTIKQTVSVVSFPRDLYVPIPGWVTQRLNTAMPHGGFQMLADTLDSNFGIRPDYYIMTDFNGFKSIVDGLGGVQVYAGSRLVDRCDLPIGEGGMCTIEPGLMNMDGDTALWYVRSRHSSSDLDRLRREQEVMTGIFTKLMSAGAAANLPSLYNRYKGAVRTSLTVQAMTPLLPTALAVFADRKQIHRYTMTVKEAKPYVTSTGAQVLLPDYDAISALLDEAIFNQ